MDIVMVNGLKLFLMTLCLAGTVLAMAGAVGCGYLLKILVIKLKG